MTLVLVILFFKNNIFLLACAAIAMRYVKKLLKFFLILYTQVDRYRIWKDWANGNELRFKNWKYRYENSEIYTLGDFISNELILFVKLKFSEKIKLSTLFIIILVIHRLVVLLQILIVLDIILFSIFYKRIYTKPIHYEDKNLFVILFWLIPLATSFLILTFLRKKIFKKNTIIQLYQNILFWSFWKYSRWGLNNSITIYQYFDKYKSHTNYPNTVIIKKIILEEFTNSIHIYNKNNNNPNENNNNKNP